MNHLDRQLAAKRRADRAEGNARGVADADAGLPNVLGVKGDLTRFQMSEAWCRGYDSGYRWRKHGPGKSQP